MRKLNRVFSIFVVSSETLHLYSRVHQKSQRSFDYEDSEIKDKILVTSFQGSLGFGESLVI